MSKDEKDKLDYEIKKDLERIRELRRQFLRSVFLKERTDPFRHMTGEGGTVFDPAIQRYSAMKLFGFEYFKPNFRNTSTALAFMIIPMSCLYYIFWSKKMDSENKLRCGEVPYCQRMHKFI